MLETLGSITFVSIRAVRSVTRLGDILDFGQLFKDIGNN